MTRGFITLATGKKYYSYLAANLLLSYRYHTKAAMPFAIITEEENEYTALFDDVIVVKDAKKSFMDKFFLFTVCPYDETIFLDADSLAYGDLNEWWKAFEGATDFSAVGGIIPLSNKGRGNYDVDGIGKYGDMIKHKVWMHAGVCFIRKAPTLEKLYDDCMDILANYDKLQNLRYPGSYEEVALGIAMPMNGMIPISEPDNFLAFIPCCSDVRADIQKGILSFTKNSGLKVNGNGIFLHFTNRETLAPLYRYEVTNLKRILIGRNKASILYYYYLKFLYTSKNLTVRIWKSIVRKVFKK